MGKEVKRSSLGFLVASLHALGCPAHGALPFVAKLGLGSGLAVTEYLLAPIAWLHEKQEQGIDYVLQTIVPLEMEDYAAEHDHGGHYEAVTEHGHNEHYHATVENHLRVEGHHEVEERHEEHYHTMVEHHNHSDLHPYTPVVSSVVDYGLLFATAVWFARSVYNRRLERKQKKHTCSTKDK